MGLAFPDKMTTLLELHRGNSWLKRQELFQELSTNHREGFFYTDEEGKTKCVSESTIMNALYDAQYWLLLEIKADRSKLTEYGLKAKDRGKVTPGHLAGVLADILDKRTRKWAGDSKAMDLDGLLNEVRKLPSNTIPTSQQLWLLLNNRVPEIFDRSKLSKKRMSQFLGLLGSKGAQLFEDVRIQIYLFRDDERLKTIRMPKNKD